MDEDMYDFMFETPCPHSHVDACEDCMKERMIVLLASEDTEVEEADADDWDIPEWED